MKNYEKILAEAVRVEFNEVSDEVYLVFQITDENLKQEIKKNWTKDIEFRLIGKYLKNK